MLVESRASTRPSSLSRNSAGHHSLPTPHDVCDNKRATATLSISLTHVTAGIIDLHIGKSIHNIVPGSPTTQIRIAVIRPHDRYLNFHILNLPHQLPAPDCLWDYTSSHDPIDMAREYYAPKLRVPCYWR